MPPQQDKVASRNPESSFSNDISMDQKVEEKVGFICKIRPKLKYSQKHDKNLSLATVEP
jgi:hypothetical protein